MLENSWLFVVFCLKNLEYFISFGVLKLQLADLWVLSMLLPEFFWRFFVFPPFKTAPVKGS